MADVGKIARRSAAVVAVVIGLLVAHESIETKAYLDVAGVPTICVGETRGVKLGDTATKDECIDRLKARIPEFEAGMARCIKNEDKLPDTTHIALLDWTYNIGIGGMCKSTLVKLLNKGDIVAACNELPKWNKARVRGKLVALKGLTKRRAVDQKLCLEQRWL